MISCVHKEIDSPFITVQKDEGIQPAAKPLHFLFTLSQSLSHNHRDCLQCNNTPCYNAFFYRGKIPWENTTVNPPWVHITVGQHTSQKKFSGAPPPNPKAGGMSV